MVRIFVGTSQINILYMILYARKTATKDNKDILVLDSVLKKESLIKVIKSSQNIYNWHEIIDLSVVISDKKEIAPGLRKRITRNVKNNVFVKPFYNFIVKMILKRNQRSEMARVQGKLKNMGDVKELNLLTLTMINQALFKLYPKANVNYFEHGIGDYIYVKDMKPRSFNFYCLFADTFKKYLQSRSLENSYVKEIPGASGFSQLAEEIISLDEDRQKIVASLQSDKRKVIILLDAMEIYQVPDSYWTDCLDLCISNITDPEKYLFVLKPHHTQASRSIKMSKDHMQSKGLEILVIENDKVLNYSIEVIFSLLNSTTDYVFSTFSSGLFYIPKLYNNPQTKYFYAFDFFRPYMKNSPAQFVRVYNEVEGIIKNVFAGKCRDISRK